MPPTPEPAPTPRAAPPTDLPHPSDPSVGPAAESVAGSGASAPADLPPELAKYYDHAPTLASYETGRGRSRGRSRARSRAIEPEQLPRAGHGSGDAGAHEKPPRKGIRERSAAESWARGLWVMGAGLTAVVALMLASAVLLDNLSLVSLVPVLGAGAVLLAARQAQRALSDSARHWFVHGGPLMVLGLLLVFAVPPLLRGLGA